MGKLKQFYKDLKELDKKFDLIKRYPDYFTRWIFKSATILMFFLFILTWYSNDWQITNTWAECPADAEKPCRNPYYLCDYIFNDSVIDQDWYYKDNSYKCLPKITWKTKSLCAAGSCDIEYIEPGQIIGNKPNKNVTQFFIRLLWIWCSAFSINHIASIYRKYKRGDYK